MLFYHFNSPQIPPNFKKNRQISAHSSSRLSKNIEGCVKKIVVSYLVCSQIWLNLPLNDCHFAFITKLTPKKKTIGHNAE
jgi:hypothetical protein